MFEKHKTREGQIMMICEMDDKHLLNTIIMNLRTIKDIIFIANTTEPLDLYEAELYGHKKINKKQAAQFTKEFAKKIAPYILEATIRNIVTELIPEIQRTFNRNTMYIKKLSLNFLPNDIEEDDEGDEDDDQDY